MGEGLLKDRIAKAGLSDKVRVRSAGTWADFGYAASENGVTVAAEDDIDIAEHRSHPITAQLIEGSHLVLVMTPEHRAEILANYPEAESRVHILTTFADEVNGDPHGVADPIGGNLAAYRKTYMELTGLIDAAMPKILQLIEEETAP